MSIGNITYGTVVNLVKNWIKTNCVNITNFAGIPSVFKSGYTSSTVFAGAGTAAVATYIYNLTGNAISSVGVSTVDNDMNNFITTIGINDKLNQPIPASEFINFINDMVSFCSTKVCFTTSQFHNVGYTVYYPQNTAYSSVVTLPTNFDIKVIEATDAIKILNSLFGVIQQNIRNVTCRYSHDLT